MHVIFMDGIDGVTGSIKTRNGGRLVFTKPKNSQKGHGRMYFRPANAYERKVPYSENEMAAMDLFKERAALVRKLMLKQHMTKAEAWKVAKQQIRKENV